MNEKTKASPLQFSKVIVADDGFDVLFFWVSYPDDGQVLSFVTQNAEGIPTLIEIKPVDMTPAKAFKKAIDRRMANEARHGVLSGQAYFKTQSH